MKRRLSFIRSLACFLAAQLILSGLFSAGAFGSSLNGRVKAEALYAADTPELPTLTCEEEQAWDLLMDEIGNPYGVAGVMGNLWAESGVMPVCYEGVYSGATASSTAASITEKLDNGTLSRDTFAYYYRGYGIAGFTHSSLKKGLYDYAKAGGYSIGNLACQIRYLMDYIRTYLPELDSILKTTTSSYTAAIEFMVRYERPADQSSYNKNKRGNLGEGYFDRFCSRCPSPLFTSSQEGWIRNTRGWWYQNPDGSYPVSEWKKINSKWYYFNDKGYMATGWIRDNSQWYYLRKSGEMATRWVKVDEKWYFLKENGRMATGWIYDNNKWYYLNINGDMRTGWLKYGGSWYYLRTDGAMATGWVFSGSNWYYMDASGWMHTGWVEISGIWYYLDENGAMVTGTRLIGQRTYDFADNGAWEQ